jgi:hypothetical protein
MRVKLHAVIVVAALVILVAVGATSVPAAVAATPVTVTEFSVVGRTITTADVCAGGESILLTSGTTEIRLVSVESSGGRIVSVLQILLKNVSGVGATTGIMYQVQDAFISQVTKSVGGIFEATLANTGLRVVGPGPDNNRWARLVIHMTVDFATGTIIANFEHFDLTCR